MNIRSAINSGDDALGKFYETFLKYANDASEMGIVLTPRHITKFAVEAIGIKDKDIIFDPTCGTGGFLVAALDFMRASHYKKAPKVYDSFRNDCLFGVEDSDNVFGLALVNMIFRGDGKSHIYNANCFDNVFRRKNGEVVRYNKTDDAIPKRAKRPFSRVLMNPPFAVKEKPREFVDYALDQMQSGGLLFGVLANVPITGRDDRDWRREILKRHTVKACIKFQKSLFVPHANKGTYGLIIETGRPHQENDPVFFAELFDDENVSNLAKTRSKERLQDNMSSVLSALKDFMDNKKGANIARQIKVTPLNMGGAFDFAPEAYLSDDISESMTAVGSTQNLLAALAAIASRANPPSPPVSPEDTKVYSVENVLDINKGKCPPLKDLSVGKTPVITTKETCNGIAGYHEVDEKHIVNSGITISANGSGGRAFWHPYKFAATTDVLVGHLKEDMPQDIEFYLYICEAITKSSWRFDYYRKCSAAKLRQDVQIILPLKRGKIDVELIKQEIAKTPDFDVLRDNLKKMPCGDRAARL